MAASTSEGNAVADRRTFRAYRHAARGRRPANTIAGAAECPCQRRDRPASRSVIEGVIHDGAGAPVTDALLEIWQAEADGRYGRAAFSGWGRAATDFNTGLFRFETIKPGATRYSDGRPQAPHVSFSIFARGINIHLQTRMYFPEEEAANAADPVLQAVGPPELIATLIARKEAKPGCGGLPLRYPSAGRPGDGVFRLLGRGSHCGKAV